MSLVPGSRQAGLPPLGHLDGVAARGYPAGPRRGDCQLHLSGYTDGHYP